MSFTNYRVEGQSSDLTTDIPTLVSNLINNQTNWTETNPAFSSVKFGSGGADGYGKYQVDIKWLTREPPQPAELGDLSTDVNDWVGIYLYVRNATRNTTPGELGNMMRMIDKILALNYNNLGSGIKYCTRPAWTLPVQTSTVSSDWFMSGRVQVQYRMVKS